MRCPDPNARIQKTDTLQIKTENTNLRLLKYKRCIFLILPVKNMFNYVQCILTGVYFAHLLADI